MAEEYNDKTTDKTTPKTTETTKTTVVREAAENGAREYKAPEKKGFPWWVLLFGLIPLFFLFRRPAQETPEPVATPAAVAVSSASPEADASAVPDAMASADSADAGLATTDGTSPNAMASSIPGKDVKVFKGTDITVAPSAGASKKGEPLTDVVTFATAPDRNALVGRKVKLTNVSVGQVLNDQAFYVGAADGQRMLVLLDRRLDAGATGPAKVTIKQGQPVSLTGILEALPEAGAAQSQYQVSASDYSGLQKEGVYLHATIAQEK